MIKLIYHLYDREAANLFADNRNARYVIFLLRKRYNVFKNDYIAEWMIG